MQKPQIFNTEQGRFVQIKNDGNILTFKAFLDEVKSDFFTDGWGWDPLRQSIYAPGESRACFVNSFLICNVRESPKKYLVNSIDLNDIYRKI